MDALMNKQQLADRLGVPVGWVTKAITARSIPITWVGRHARFSEEDFADIKAMGKRPVPLRIVRSGHPPAGPQTPPPPPRPKHKEKVA